MTNILVLGDAFVDRWLTVGGTRQSAEQDGLPIYDISSERQQQGGAANVAHALTNLVDNAIIRVDDQYLPRTYERPVKTRLLLQGRQVCRFDVHDWVEPIRLNSTSIYDDTIVVISDYCKGSINEATIKAIAASPAQQIWVNAKSIQPHYECLAVEGDSGRLCWTCNEAEWQAARTFYDRQAQVCVTKAQKGIELVEFGHSTGSVMTYPGPVVSVCGAGDVVLAALVTAPEGVCRLTWAMAAASVAVGRPFTYCPTREEVEKVYYGQ